jgi:16S rRNA (cytidine1402-2'-O)-methyltransferase
MSGKLYVVATPIGNLEDVSPRALRVLREVDLIAAEDTRHTGHLLARFEIRKPLVSYHQFSEASARRSSLRSLPKGNRSRWSPMPACPA